MTYDEVASLLECSADQARRQVHLERLNRKHSRDGKTRVKLGVELTALFLARIRTAPDDLDQAIQDLLRMREAMGQSLAVDGELSRRRHASGD